LDDDQPDMFHPGESSRYMARLRRDSPSAENGERMTVTLAPFMIWGRVEPRRMVQNNIIGRGQHLIELEQTLLGTRP